MRLVFSERAWEDYLYWQANDPKLLARLNALIKECARTPFSGPASQTAPRTAVRLMVSAADARAPSCRQAVGDGLLTRNADTTIDRALT